MPKENTKTEIKIFCNDKKIKELDKVRGKLYNRPRRSILEQALDEFLERNK